MMRTSPCLALLSLLLLGCGSASLSPDRRGFPIEVATETIPLEVTDLADLLSEIDATVLGHSTDNDDDPSLLVEIPARTERRAIFAAYPEPRTTYAELRFLDIPVLGQRIWR